MLQRQSLTNRPFEDGKPFVVLREHCRPCVRAGESFQALATVTKWSRGSVECQFTLVFRWDPSAAFCPVVKSPDERWCECCQGCLFKSSQVSDHTACLVELISASQLTQTAQLHIQTANFCVFYHLQKLRRKSRKRWCLEWCVGNIRVMIFDGLVIILPMMQ